MTIKSIKKKTRLTGNFQFASTSTACSIHF